MELKTCSHFHFIQAIRMGLVENVLNVNSHGRPVLRFKKLEDVYESEYGKIRDSPLQPQDSYKTECPCPALIGWKTKERESNTNMSYCNYAGDDEGTDDLSCEKMTLKQFKERCKTKKRKALHSLYLSSKQDYIDWHPAEDECDLEEPISTRTKIAKNPIGKMKHAKKYSSLSPRTEVLMTSVQIPSAENPMQCSPYLPVLSVKVEVFEKNNVECRDITCSSDETSNFYGEQEICALRPELKSQGMISFTDEESRTCTLNEVCFDHLKHTEPSYLLPSICVETADAENLRKTCKRSLDFPTSEDNEGRTEHLLLEKICPGTNFTFNDQGSDTSTYFQGNSFIHEISRQTNSVCGIQVTDMSLDSSFCCIKPKSAGDLCSAEDDIDENCPPNPEMDSLGSSFCEYDTSWDSIPCSSPEVVLHSANDDQIATETPPLIFISVDTARDLLSPRKCQVDFEGGSTVKEEKQPLRSTADDSERNSSENPHHGYCVHKSSLPELNSNYHPEQGHPPERLLSTRKAISPTSQKKLCQAMKGVELDQKIDQLKNDRKGSPPTCFRKVPHVSRSRPQVPNVPTSIQSCSDRAIAFSQRQMHDIEGLATKLMHELKFMKDIIEVQVHSEASDEVKAAIKSATKAEETARKWLSMMNRDCTRFCKLMRFNEKGDIASATAIPKKRKKITFADEAGGMLCHVKLIEEDS